MCDPINIDITPPRSQPKIDLNTCKKGQKLKDREDNIYTYDAPTQHDSDIHGLVDPADNYTYRWDNGRVNKGIVQGFDIVEILPLATEKPKVINLNDCKPGQKLRRRDGKIVAYRSKNKGNVGNTYGHIVDHNKDTYDTHTDTGLVFVSSTNPPDIVEILPLENVVDLNTCKKGQKLKDRHGDIYTYDKPEGSVHLLMDDQHQSQTRWDNGQVNAVIPGRYDIVEILPLDPEKPKIDLNICQKGQKLRTREGKIVTYVRPSSGKHSGIHDISKEQSTFFVYSNGRGNSEDIPSRDHFNDIVEILPLEEEIPILYKVSTVDDVEFQMWDKVNEEYYGVVSAEFARKLEDNNRKLIKENTSLLNRIKQLEKENTNHLAKIEHSRLEINRLITTGHKQVEVIDSREEELRAANKAIEKYKDRIEKLELSDKAIQRKEYERRLIARGWYVETAGAYKGDWVNPANGWHYAIDNAIAYL